jgi:hypothetical protein
MKTTQMASTGASVVVWRHEDVFHARLAGSICEPQICLAEDLFEVLAELAGLDLDNRGQAAEAIELAEQAELLLSGELLSGLGDDGGHRRERGRG